MGLASKVLVLARATPNLPTRETLMDGVFLYRMKLHFDKYPKNIFTEAVKYLELLIRSLILCRAFSPTHVHSHSLSVLITGVAIKFFFRSKLIYDPHELETERAGLQGIRKKVSKGLEKLLISFADEVIVVGPSIADWYTKKYKLKSVHVIKNIPKKVARTIVESNVLREELGLDKDKIVFIYQGLFIEGRGIEITLKAFNKVFRNLPNPPHVVFMGYGRLEPLIDEHIRLSPNIHKLPPARIEDIIKYTSGADVGLAMFENVCLSYLYSSPNKFFEYIIAGVPVVITPCPDMMQVVRDHQTGWVVEENEDSFVEFLNTISRAEIKNKTDCTKQISNTFCWEAEAQAYRCIY